MPRGSTRYRSASRGILLLLLSALAGAGILAAQSGPAGAPPAPSSVDQQREEAVLRARQGHLAEALAELRRLHARYPEDPAVAHDLLVILQWAGEDAAALELAETLEAASPTEPLPPYVAEAAARAARNLERFVEAAARYDRLLALPGLDPEMARRARRQRILTLAEMGAPGLALEALREAGRETGREMGAASPAPPSPLLEPAEMRRLTGDRAAQAVRWGELPPAHPGRLFVETDRALELLEHQVAVAPEGSPAWRRARLDRLLALHQRHRMEEVVTEAAELEDAGIPLPPWAASARASAHLTLGEPEEAARLYEQLALADPGDWNARVGLFYARVEAGRFPAALEGMAAVAEDHPPWRVPGADRPPQPDPLRLEADTLLALGHAYYGDPATAHEFFAVAARRAPLNLGLQEKLGNIERWRGWPRAALATAERALAHAPHPGERPPPVGLALLRTSTLLDLGRLPEARRQIDLLRQRHPENLHVRRLDHRWDLESGWEVYLDALGADSEGTGANPLGTSDQSTELYVHAPAVSATGWRARPFLHLRSSEAEFRDTTGEFRRLGLGLGWRGRGGWRGQVEIHGDVAGDADADEAPPVEGEDDLGLALGFQLPLGDRWSLDGELDTESPHVPLQARRAGIGGEGGRLAATWRPSERGRVALAVGRWDFDDDNRRRSLLLVGERLWQVAPRWRLSTTLELSASDNSRLGAPYFNPEEDATAHLVVTQDFLAWRRYQRSWTHRLVAGGGSYWQQGFGSAAIWTARYEHDWNLSAGFGLRYGVLWSSRVYDGGREERTGWLLTSLWRF